MSGIEHVGYDGYGRPIYRAVYVPPQGPQGGGGGGLGPQLIGGAIVLALAAWGLNEAGVIDAAPDIKSKAGAPTQQGGGKYGAAILNHAFKYDHLGYQWGGGHPPGAWLANYKKGSKRGLDCSGLVNVAVYQATGGRVKDDEVAQGYRYNKHWKKISYREARAGDIMWRKKRPGDYSPHVVIVVKNNGDGKLEVFEAATRNAPYAQQILKKSGQHYSRFDGAYRFKG